MSEVWSFDTFKIPFPCKQSCTPLPQGFPTTHPLYVTLFKSIGFFVLFNVLNLVSFAHLFFLGVCFIFFCPSLTIWRSHPTYSAVLPTCFGYFYTSKFWQMHASWLPYLWLFWLFFPQSTALQNHGQPWSQLEQIKNKTLTSTADKTLSFHQSLTIQNPCGMYTNMLYPSRT